MVSSCCAIGQWAYYESDPLLKRHPLKSGTPSWLQQPQRYQVEHPSRVEFKSVQKGTNMPYNAIHVHGYLAIKEP